MSGQSVVCIAEAAVNATNMTNPEVTPEAEVANPWRAGCGCATRRMDVMNDCSIAHSKWAMCLWSVAVRRGFLTVKELLLKGLVRCELGHQDARLGKATIG
jgi:hypothetical protein